MESFDSFSLSFNDENIRKEIESREWVKDMKSRIFQITEKAIMNWCNIVIKLGENDINLSEWMKIFEKHVTDLYNDLEQDIDGVREKTLDTTEKLSKRLCYLEKELRIPGVPIDNFEQMSLYQVKKLLATKVEEYESIYKARSEEFNSLRNQQSKFCKILEISTPKFHLSDTQLPTEKELEEFRLYIKELEDEKSKRLNKFFNLKSDILNLIQQLEKAPKLSYEKEIVYSEQDPINLITETKIKQYEIYNENLKRQLKNVEAEIAELRKQIDEIWNQLDVDIMERSNFTATTAGKSVQATLEALKKEYSRCRELKKANIKIFIDKLREDLEKFWTICRCSSEDKNKFKFFQSDVYNEDLLEIHERELEKYKNFHETNKELFDRLNEFDQLVAKQLELEFNDNKNRYKNRGGQLLKEERERNKIMKRLPIVESTCIQLAQTYLRNNNKPFLIYNETIEEYIFGKKQEIEAQKKLRSSAKKQKTITTPASTTKKTAKNLFVSSCKRTATPTLNNESKVKKQRTILSTPSTIKITVTAPSTKKRRSSEEWKKRLQRRQQMQKKLMQERKENAENTYRVFEEDLSARDNCRSTLVNTDLGVAPLTTTPLKPIENTPF